MDIPSEVKVLLIDDHPVVRNGVMQALLHAGFSEIVQATTISESLHLITKTDFDLIVADYQLGDGIGVDIAAPALMKNSSVCLALLTLHSDWSIAEKARRAGFSTLISKECSLDSIVETLIKSLSLNLNFSVLGGKSETLGTRLITPLTATEEIVLSALSAGLTTREIATARFCADATIKSHITSIYRKLGVRNRVEAVTWAQREGY